MNSAEYVANLITDQKAAGTDLQTVAWNAALACVGWPYVFGARGQYCTPANRRARYSDDHPTIKTACKNYDGTGSCSGCKWLPGGQKVRSFDCRGFPYWILKQVYDGWELKGAGATSQWNTEANWAAKWTVADGMPQDTLVCLFVQKGTTMEHTGFGLNNETVECSSGVQHYTSRKAKWTHWAVPACCVDGSIEPVKPAEPTTTTLPTIRKGSRGQDVMYAQMLLIQRGYSCGSCGADGIFGNDTLYAVRKYQLDHALAMDGVIGPATWDALISPEVIRLYTVHIPGLPKFKAEALVSQYSGAYMTEDGDAK